LEKSRFCWYSLSAIAAYPPSKSRPLANSAAALRIAG
jgi:hypothetical protein